MGATVSQGGSQRVPDDESSKGVSRRRVLTAGAGLAAGVGVTAACYSAWRNSTYLFLLKEAPKQAKVANPAWAGAHVERYRALGKTGVQMSDISFGGAGIGDPDVVARAFDRGINYFDTSPDYSR